MHLPRHFISVAWLLRLRLATVALAVAVGLLATSPGQASGVPDTPSSQRLVVEYYHSPGCPGCIELERDFLAEATNRLANVLEFRAVDINKPANFLRLLAVQERLGRDAEETLAVVVDDRVALFGAPEIRARLEAVIEERRQVLPSETGLSDADRTAHTNDVSGDANSQATLRRRFERFTVGSIIVAGLVDGINPCAFATIVFFATLLAANGIRGRSVLAVGAGFVLAAFATYLLMGFGVVQFGRWLPMRALLGNLLRVVMPGVLALLAWLSFRDAWRYRRDGAGGVTLKLPVGIQRRIRSRLRTGLDRKRLFMAGVGLGVPVTLLESVCTGQVYLPVLVLLSRDDGMRTRAIPLLVLYNLLFVAPLVVVLLAAARGVGNDRLIDWSKRNVVLAKLSLGALFLFLAFVAAWR